MVQAGGTSHPARVAGKLANKAEQSAGRVPTATVSLAMTMLGE